MHEDLLHLNKENTYMFIFKPCFLKHACRYRVYVGTYDASSKETSFDMNITFYKHKFAAM